MSKLLLKQYERRMSLRLNSPWIWALRGIAFVILSQLAVSVIVWPALFLLVHFFVGTRDVGWDFAVAILSFADVAGVVAGTALLITATHERLPTVAEHRVALFEAKLAAESDLDHQLQLPPS